MEKISLKIATPEKVIFKDYVDQITLPTTSGEITVLPNHIPLISILQPGEIKIIKDNEETPLAVSGGFIEIQAEKVVILADTAEKAYDIDLERAEAARERAEKAMKEKKTDATEYAYISAKIEKELARLRIGKKYKKLGQGYEKK